MRRLDTYLPLDAAQVREVELRYQNGGDTLGVAVIADWVFVGEEGEERVIRVVMSSN